MIKLKPLQNNIAIVLIADALLISVSLYLAHLVRFEFSIPDNFLRAFLQIVLFVILTKLVCFYCFDLYRGMWRYTGISDLLNVIKAASVSTLIIVFFILFKYRFIGFSRSVFVIDWCFTILFIAGFRLIVRVCFEYGSDGVPILEILKSIDSADAEQGTRYSQFAYHWRGKLWRKNIT